MKRILLSAGLLLSACSSESSCILEAGQYESVYTELTGNCGPGPATSVAISEGSYPGVDSPDCLADNTVSDNGCSVQTSARCDIDGADVHIENSLEYASRTQMEGILEMTIDETDGTFCQSRYRVVWHKIN